MLADFGGMWSRVRFQGSELLQFRPGAVPADSPARAVTPDELNGDSACATLLPTPQMRSRNGRSNRVAQASSHTRAT